MKSFYKQNISSTYLHPSLHSMTPISTRDTPTAEAHNTNSDQIRPDSSQGPPSLPNSPQTTDPKGKVSKIQTPPTNYHPHLPTNASHRAAPSIPRRLAPNTKDRPSTPPFHNQQAKPKEQRRRGRRGRAGFFAKRPCPEPPTKRDQTTTEHGHFSPVQSATAEKRLARAPLRKHAPTQLCVSPRRTATSRNCAIATTTFAAP